MKASGIVKKYRIAFYQKSGSMWMTNGGKLMITENEYIIKYLFHTVARFDVNKTIAFKKSANFLYHGIYLTDGTKSIDLYFFSKTARELYHIFSTNSSGLPFGV